MTNTLKKYFLILLIYILLVISIIFSLFAGRIDISMSDMVSLFSHFITGSSLGDNDRLSNLYTIIFEIRLPRIIGAVLIGAGLSISGAMMQSVFANPLVSPGIMGVLSGASFGAAFGIVFFSSWLYIQISSFVFGILSLLLALLIAGIHRSSSTIMLVLGGMISGAFFNSALSIVKMLADPDDELASIVFWLMGSLSMSDTDSSIIISEISLFIIIILSLFFGRVLNILSMGDDEAKTLGFNPNMYRIVIIIISGILASLTVVIAGNIGWLGLIIPHISRMITGPDNRYLLPFSAAAGGIFLLLTDTFIRTAFSSDVPLGIITSLTGIVVFIIVLKNNKRGWH